MDNEIINLEKIPDIFLYRSLKKMSGHALPNTKADSVKIEYRLNTHGYRCDEFTNQKILTLGCSQTEGHALPIELTWPYLMSQKMNKGYINLAKGGDGMQAQIVKAFQFFKEFYHPTHIFAVFPITRMEAPLINLKVKNNKNIKNLNTEDYIGKALFSNNWIEKFSKEPHTIENVLPEEFAIFYNILFMKIFIQYCKSNNIKLVWTYYNDSSLEKYSFTKFTDTYFESPYIESVCIPKELGCHMELSDNKFFDYAADYEYWPPGHYGFHKHLHIAEEMLSML